MIVAFVSSAKKGNWEIPVDLDQGVQFGGPAIVGFDQVEPHVIKVGMFGEVACITKPWTIVPMVVTEVQRVIVSGQVRQTDMLVDLQQLARPGTITVLMEPLYRGQLDDLPQRGNCIANLYANNHEALQSEDLTIMNRTLLHLIDTVDFVHALILRMQALLLPVQTLVLGGH